MANEYIVKKEDLVNIANSIREKSGLTENIVFPSGFIDINTDTKIIDGSISGEYINKGVKVVKNSAFAYCTNLTSISLPNCTNITYRAFYRTRNLKSLDLPNLTTISEAGAFGVIGVEILNLPNLTTLGSNTSDMCNSSPNLTTVNFPKLSGQSISGTSFAYCPKLTTVILGGNVLNSLQYANVFNSTPIASGNGHIYVPTSLVDEYKAATNWTTYANQIRAIEDYPEITGVF